MQWVEDRYDEVYSSIVRQTPTALTFPAELGSAPGRAETCYFSRD